MSAQYDSIAEAYRQSKSSPIRRYVEAWSFMSLVGVVEGRDVLDVACGEGFYTRRLKEAGAARVVGADISAEMIRLARDAEHHAPLGIDYLCTGAESLPDLGPFDLVTAAYLLHYAPNESALLQMCRRIAAQLKPGGRFVALNENPDQGAERCAGYDQYGFNKEYEHPRRDGSRITYWMMSGRSMFSIEAFYFARPTYERVLALAGFRDIRWHPLTLDPAGSAAHGDEYFAEYLDNPPVIGLECRT